MKHFAGWDERTLDLCVDRFTVGLDREDEVVLDRLANRADIEEFERAIAAVHLGFLTDLEAPPAALLERIEREGRRNVVTDDASARASAGRIVPFPSRAIAVAGWLVAAILLFMLVPFGASEDDVFVRRETLVADAVDLVRASWTATEDAAAVGASGDVVWSSSRQEGYMRFQGLAPNDPEENQYQLWIFDPTRADWEAKPVDGGVFDVPSNGEVVVPIDAKLAVADTALFAITVEVPGGVVVSERERLALTASP
jgi:anti-sigma-K factor RskA